MQMYPGIKRFVQETLGCSCPEEVFNILSTSYMLYQEYRRIMQSPL